MYKISKQFEFCASHNLVGLKEGHPCMRMHGHNYKVTMTFQAEKLNEQGFIIDYRELQPIKEWIDDVLDHRHLNEILSTQPSAENIAKFIYQTTKALYPQLSEVSVSETDKTSATYYE